MNDGKFGERWFIAAPAELTMEFAQTETIERIIFSHDRTATSDNVGAGLGPFVTEYQVLVSADGKSWQPVADSLARPKSHLASLLIPSLSTP